MPTPLTLEADATRLDTGGIEFTVHVINDGEEEVKFSTASARLFILTVEAADDASDLRWAPSVGYTQAFEYWTLAPGERLTRAFEWQTPAEWEEFYEDLSYDMSVEDYPHPDPEAADEFEITVGFCATDDDLRPDDETFAVSV